MRLRGKEQYDLYTGAMQRAEVVFFMRLEEQVETELFLSQIKTESVDQGVVDVAGVLYRKWHPGNGIDVNDAILAATVMQTGGVYLYSKHQAFSDARIKCTKRMDVISIGTAPRRPLNACFYPLSPANIMDHPIRFSHHIEQSAHTAE